MILKVGALGNARILNNKVMPALNALKQQYVLSCIGTRNSREVSPKHQVNYLTYEQVIESDIDLVYIALPNSLHEFWVEKALKKNKHVLCEKPFSTSPDTLKKILNLARKNGCLVRENFQFLHHSQTEKIKSILDSKILGQVNLIRVDFGFPKFENTADIRYSKKLSGGALGDAGAYVICFLREFFPEEWKIKSSLCQRLDGFEVEMGGAIQAVSESGKLAQLFYHFSQDYVCRFEILGENGRLKGDRIFTAPENYDQPLELIQNGKTTFIDYPRVDHFQEQFRDIHRIIESNQFEEDRSKIEAQAMYLNRCYKEAEYYDSCN